jgi:hypothetical protein
MTTVDVPVLEMKHTGTEGAGHGEEMEGRS